MEGPFVRCLMVETGEEKTVLQLLHARQLGRGMFPQRIRVRKIRKVWRKDRIRLLPGYVFVYTDEEIPIWKYQRLEHVLKVLRYDREPHGYLKGNDLEFANTIQELDGKLDVLNAVDEDGFIHVTDILLNQLHGEVISVNKGKRQVDIRVNLMGQTKIIQMNYQLLDAEGKPIDPVTEMLDDESDEWLTAWTPDFADELADRMDREEELPWPEETLDTLSEMREGITADGRRILPEIVSTEQVTAEELDQEAMRRWQEAEDRRTYMMLELGDDSDFDAEMDTVNDALAEMLEIPDPDAAEDAGNDESRMPDEVNPEGDAAPAEDQDRTEKGEQEE